MTAAKRKPSPATDLLVGTRITLTHELAEVALRCAALEARIDELDQEKRVVGFDLLSARAELRNAVAQLELHDRRRRGSR